MELSRASCIICEIFSAGLKSRSLHDEGSCGNVDLILAEVASEQTCESLAVASFVTENLKNAVKTGIFNRLAQNQHKSIKIYAVDFSS